MDKIVYYLQPSSFCFGVKRSIDQLHEIIKKHPNEHIFCIHALVHNPKVSNEFKQLWVTFVESIDEVKDTNAVIIFSAHGTNRAILAQAQNTYKAVYNLECPFVSKIYTEVDNFIREWITTFMYIGKENHQEGKNILNYITSQWGTSYVISDKDTIPVIDSTIPFAVLSQTTLNFEYVQEILQDIQKQYPHAKAPLASDVCKATYERQTVVLQNLWLFDTFIVIGGKESNNTKELAEIGKVHHKQTFYGESLKDIIQYPESELFAHTRVAITWWASTPREDIQEVFEYYTKRGYTPKICTLQ